MSDIIDTNVSETEPTKVTRKRATKRPARKPVGLRMTDQTKPRAGYYARWVNDTGSRIQAFEEGWYEKVIGDDGNPVSRIGGKSGKQYLMEIPLETYEDDQREKQRQSAASVSDLLEVGAGQYKPNK